MRPRLVCRSLLALVVCLLPTLPGGIPLPQPGRLAAASWDAKPARAWQTQPPVVDLKTTEDILALGDVHGDYDRLVTLLTAAKVIPKAPPRPEDVGWSAGKAVLVCTGDLIDKGEQSLPVILLMRALQSAAARDGGRVIVTMGNHEAEFLADPANTKAQKFIAELKAKGIQPESVAAGRDALGVGAYLRGLPFAARVNDWFFAHAGDTRKRSLKQLSAELQEGVDAHGFDPKLVEVLDGLLEARLHPAPWWEKEAGAANASKEKLALYAQALGVKHMVLGHQPGKVMFADGSRRKKGQLFQNFDGLLFLIDVGMSRGIDPGNVQGYSEGALLRIRATPRPHATVLYPDGRHEKIWEGN